MDALERAGVHIPDAIVARLRGAADEAREGRNCCVDLLQELRTIKGVSGAHIMAYRQEESVAAVIDRSVCWRDGGHGTQQSTQRPGRQKTS